MENLEYCTCACSRCSGCMGQLTSDPVACPSCGDTYGDLWEHLVSGVKGCGAAVLALASWATGESARQYRDALREPPTK